MPNPNDFTLQFVKPHAEATPDLPPLIKEVDPVLEALLAEEAEIATKVGPGPRHPGSPFGNRRGVLEEADSLVNGDRNRDYGDPIEDFRRTAGMWGHYLGMALDPHDVAAMMAMVKLSRIRQSPGKRDHWVDVAGYAACGWDTAARENDE